MDDKDQEEAKLKEQQRKEKIALANCKEIKNKTFNK